MSLNLLSCDYIESLTSHLVNYFVLGRGAKYCDQRVCVSVRLFVCLFVCPLAYLENHKSKLTTFYPRDAS